MILGIEIGGTKLQLAAGDAKGRIQERRRLHVDPAGGAEGIRGQIEQALPELTKGTKVEAVGVGFGGPVDWERGRICRSHHVEGWSEFAFAEWLQALVKAPVFLENDANVATLGEATHGAGMGRDPVFYVTLGSGVGGGLVVHGEIYHGATPGEAEIGHVRLDRSGVIVEDRCSGWAVDRRIRALAEPESELCRLAKAQARPGGEARHLAAGLSKGDKAARMILEETAGDLAFALSHVTHLFHPEMIVLGGGLSLLGEVLRAAVARSLPGFLMEAFRPGPEVVLAALGEDAVPVGALALAARRLGRREG